MQRILNLIVKPLAIGASIISLAIAVIWPWPAPAVDRRTPLDAALAHADCPTAVNIVDAAADASADGAEQLRWKFQTEGPCNEPMSPANNVNCLALHCLFNQSAQIGFGVAQREAL